MAILGVDDFKSKLIGGGARGSLFKVTPNFPGFAQGDAELASFMCKGATLPASTIAALPIKFRGREIKLSGERTFAPWTITIINDGSLKVRSSFERWMNGINSHEGNIGMNSTSDYMADMIVEQLDKEGTPVKTYTIKGAWPSELGEVALSYEDTNITESSVTLEYQYWTSDTTT
jgi:hypothetical protein